MPVIIYHNPRCTKSRQTLKLIQDQGIEPKIIEYLNTPPSASELRKLLKQMGLRATQLVRKKEPEYKKAGLDRDGVTDEDIIAALVKYPKLIERPIVIAGGRAVLGRPPENVLKLL